MQDPVDKPDDQPHSPASLSNELTSAIQRAATRLRFRFPDIPQDVIDDAVGDATTQWLERYEASTPPGATDHMLSRLAEWRLLDRISSDRRQITLPPNEIDRRRDSGPDVEKRVLGRETRRFVDSVYLLTARSRRVLSLWSKGYSFREISLRLHLKMVTIRKKKERAIRKLRSRFGRGKGH